MHTNIRGYDSKATALHAIINQVKPSIVTINETFLKNNRKLKIPEYLCFNRNRQDVGGGGIATCIQSKDAAHTLKVAEGAEDHEMLITRHSQFSTPINIINMYGEQECRSKNEEIKEKWYKVLTEISKIEAKGELFILIGDLNRHVGGAIPGNERDTVSFGGKLITDMLKSGRYILVNASDKATGGPYTRYDPADPDNEDKKSALSLCIVPTDLYQYIESLEIDKNRTITPSRPISKNMVRYTDHFTLLLTFKNLIRMPNKPVAGKKTVRWNTNKEGGWKSYEEMTTDNEALEKIADSSCDDPNEIMKKIDKVLEGIKHKCFGKVKEKWKPKINKELEALQTEKRKVYESGGIKESIDQDIEAVDKKIAAALLQEQKEVFEKELEEIRSTKRRKGTAAAVFLTKEKIVGSKKMASEAVVVIDPKTNEEVNTPEGIKRVALEYCCDLLTNRKPNIGYEEDIKMKKLIHEVRMKDDGESEEVDELKEDRFEETYAILAKRRGEKYKFICRAGESLKAAVMKLCHTVWKKEKLPERWYKSTLIQSYKGKGPRGVLDNQRHLHLKDEFPKFFGHLVVTATKEKMIKNMSKFQIGTKPGHRPQEHLFVLKSIVALYLHYNRAIILSMWDVSKFFDREALTDCMNELFKNEIKGKLYRLLFQMNKNTRISVQTPVGPTEDRDTGEGLGQGTLEGALVSAVNLDNGVNDFFRDSEYEVSYGDVQLQPLLYQDDVARLADDVEAAQMGNDKMEAVAETKLLDYNLDKSCYIVIGGKIARELIEEKIDANPLTLCGVAMVKETEAKYLGDYISSYGLAHSVESTVNKRRGLAVRSIFEIRAVIDDFRSATAGGITAGLDIWEMAVLPMLLNNAECWLGMSDNTIQELDKLQLMFIRSLLTVGSGCPTPSLYMETGLIPMKFRILQKKLLFLHHLLTLQNPALAKEILEVQIKLKLPGLYQECENFLVTNNITRVESFSKVQWKNLVKRKMKELHKAEMIKIAKVKHYKKIRAADIEADDFKLKRYFSVLDVPDARLRFKIRTSMTPTVMMNFQSDIQYTHTMWACVGCASLGDGARRDTQTHIMSCSGYDKFRQGKDMTNDKEIVQYFRQVIQHRLESATL